MNIGAPVAADDPENDGLTYTLTGMEAAAFTIVERTGQLRTSEALDYEMKSSYSFTVEVHDGRDGSGNTDTTIDDTQAVTITVENVEEEGTVTLTTDTGTIQARVEVTAALEDDDIPSGVTWQWARSPNGRTLWVNIQGATSAAYTPTLEEDRGSYIRATASYTDGHGPNKSAAQVSARVGDAPPVNSAPVFPSTENGRREVEENSAEGSAVGDPGGGDRPERRRLGGQRPPRLLADRDGRSLVHHRCGHRADQAGGGTRQLDYEDKRTYRVTVEVTDGRDQYGDDDMDAIDDRQNVTITVTNVNEAPVITTTSTTHADFDVDENTMTSKVIKTYEATDVDASTTLTWSLEGNDAGDFTITKKAGGRGELRFASVPNFETPVDADTMNDYDIRVKVRDNGISGNRDASNQLEDTLAVTITVENVEEEGTVTLTTDTGTIQARVEVTAALEDDDGPTGVTWQWARSPNGRTLWVNIQGATLAAYTPTLEEDRGNYIRATASYTDGHGPNKTAAQVSARVGDPPPVNSEPVFPSTESGRREVEENSAEGTAIGAPVEATDLNAGDSAVNDPLAYSLSGTDAASFTIDEGTGQIRLASDVELDYEGKRTYRVTVEVTDGRDQNGDDDMDAIDDRQNVTITVTNVNEAPVVTGDSTPSVKENSSSMVARYTATDPERDTLTWSVPLEHRLGFWISDRGQLYFRSLVSFEDSGARYGVVVIATDDDVDNPLSHEVLVTITVENVEEPGVVTISPPRGWVDVTTQFNAALSDDDGGVTGTTWQWARSPNGRSSWTDIASATLDSYTVTADDANQYLRATASYTDGQGSGKTASATLRAPVGDAIPVTNTAPAFSEATTTPHFLSRRHTRNRRRARPERRLARDGDRFRPGRRTHLLAARRGGRTPTSPSTSTRPRARSARGPSSFTTRTRTVTTPTK